MPKMMQAKTENTRVKSKLPPAASVMRVAILRPRPVRVTTPMMMPQQAQAAAMPAMLRAPVSKEPR